MITEGIFHKYREVDYGYEVVVDIVGQDFPSNDSKNAAATLAASLVVQDEVCLLLINRAGSCLPY